MTLGSEEQLPRESGSVGILSLSLSISGHTHVQQMPRGGPLCCRRLRGESPAPPGRKARAHCPEQPITAGGILGSGAETAHAWPCCTGPALRACHPVDRVPQTPPRLFPWAKHRVAQNSTHPVSGLGQGGGPVGMWPHVLLGQISSGSGLVSPRPQQLTLHVKPCHQPGCTVGTNCLAVFLWLCSEALVPLCRTCSVWPPMVSGTTARGPDVN